jgi:hypothetical protein
MAQSNVRNEVRQAKAGRVAETAEQRAYRAAIQPGGSLWPELRIGRRADFESMSQSVDDWNLWLNRAGMLNRRAGLIRALGTIEVHMVTDREMREMVQGQDPSITRDYRKAHKRYDEIRRNFRSFVSSNEAVAHAIDWAELCERPDLMGHTHKVDPTSLLSSSTRPFRKAALAMRPVDQNGVIGYDGNVFGFDLSQNRWLYGERSDSLHFLRTEEGLDTARFTRKDWQPHATIFDVNQHLRADDLMMRWPSDSPTEMEFGPAQDLTRLS